MLLQLIFFLHLLHFCVSCSCPYPCPSEGYCSPTPSSCASGQIIKDRCSCCDVCAKVAAQKCNGWCGMYGKCAEELYCDLPIYIEGTLDVIYAGGICRQNNPKDDCCETEVSETFDFETETETLVVSVLVSRIEISPLKLSLSLKV